MLRVVVVTMDSHLSSAAVRAEAAVCADVPGLRLALHAADEWGADPAALEACLADIATADIVIASMLFLDDHIRAVLPALAARRNDCLAMICFMSASEVVKLTRIGRFDMSADSSGVMAMLKRLRGGRGKGPTSGRDQMKALRRLPKLLRLIPGTAQDVRAYFLAMQYWLAGSEENLGNLLRLLIDRYAGVKTGACSGPLRVAAPVVYPDVGVYHPRVSGRIAETRDALPVRAGAGTVGLLVLRAYVLAGNAAHYDGVIAALEARGLNVVPAFASGLDARPAIERFFMEDGRATVDAIVSLTGFSLVGGPAYNDARAAEAILAQLDVPYVAAHPVEFQSLEQWQADTRGLTPVEATMMVAIPELDGGILPMTFGGRSTAGEHRRDMAVHPERAATLAARVGRLVDLRRSARASRRVAIVLFNFPPNAGSVGTAAYLAVFESLHRTLGAMAAGGYAVEVPASVDALREMLLGGNASLHGTPANVAARVRADAHVRAEPHLAQIERQWGPAPGRHQSDGADIFVLGAQFGNVFVGIQPAFGYEGDPMRLLFEGGFAPTHAFSAFYRWMRDEFGAQAVLHFGTHGALEFMPGKQAGLSAACWPDRLIGDLPNYYLYASNNPSEGMLAKRRAGATLISYLTPPVTKAGLYRGLIDLKASLDRWRQLEPDADAQQRATLAELLQAQAAAVDLAPADPPWGARAAAAIDALGAALLELEYTLIPHGLHVIGLPPDAAQRAEMLDAAGVTEPERRATLDALLAADHELPAMLHALDGGYLRPAPGGDLMRTTDVLPTGRNLHGFDPFRIPSAFALTDGARQADRLLARHLADGGALPETVAMVLWGTDNLKTEGGPIAQALWLMGAAPRLDSYGRLCGAALLPLDRIGRPRIDVVVTLSGIFRDLLPLQTKLLAEAALLAAEADEAPAMNHIRRHALAFQAAHGGTLADAALRVFGNAEGAYGANVNQLVDAGSWRDEDELADAYVRRKGFAYGTDGRPARHDTVLADALSRVDVTYQNLDSVELGVTTVDHYFDTLGGISRAVRRARGGTDAAVYIGDQTRGDGTVRTLAEQVALETRTRALNPKWYEALLTHGYEGVREIESQVTNTLGWSATTGQVAPWIYERLSETFMLDPAMRERLATLNPTASAKIAGRLIEAHERRYWTPDPATLDLLRRAGEELEDRLEGIIERAAA
ncbi:magnesium chelatase subunit H [Acidisphaera rubrifaciens HS-AP3]|uniref:magnesium chelatase n=2 Tax=Acidisphaera TaxID=50714 RepID=A0A0D6P468_9PROT|nr:magnesium chelatase subunit H [Acidisphaera rubrifaciens HS-AP3]